MAYYSALIDRAADGSFGVVFPDAPGCTSAGETLDAAADNAALALRDWIEAREASGLAIDGPRPLDALNADPEVRAAIGDGAIILAVPGVVRRGKTVRAQVTMDEAVLETIDAAARRTGETRSGFLVRAALAAVQEAS